MTANVHMTKGNGIRYYRVFSGAEGYILGFEYNKEIYMIKVKEIMPRYIRVERTSSKKGGHEKLQFRLTKAHKEQLIRKGAVVVGGKEVITEIPHNKGVSFERAVYRMHGQTPRAKDSVGFWVGGDINIDGIEYQVKFDGAQIVEFNTLKNLQNKRKLGEI